MCVCVSVNVVWVVVGVRVGFGFEGGVFEGWGMGVVLEDKGVRVG